jgi:molecular chaperone Hsp33
MADRDDLVIPFRTQKSNVKGRIVRLGPSAEAILNRHDYPEPVSHALGEALALVAMLGTNLKNDGAILTLQAKTDGPISMLVADYKVPGALRACATFDAEAVGELEHDSNPKASGLGAGSLALTMDPGEGRERYQGIIELTGNSLTEAAHTYFHQSEQLPTYVRLAVARLLVPNAESQTDGAWTWRAGGLMIQHLSRQGGRHDDQPADNADSDRLTANDADMEDWNRAQLLAATVENHELVDPTLNPEQLLYRLFHEEQVVVYPDVSVREQCRCSRGRVENILRNLPDDDRDSLIDETGRISVKCDFCSERYFFDR